MQREGIERLKERGVLRRYIRTVEAGWLTITPTTKPMAVFVLKGNLERRDGRVLLLKMAMVVEPKRSTEVRKIQRQRTRFGGRR